MVKFFSFSSPTDGRMIIFIYGVLVGVRSNFMGGRGSGWVGGGVTVRDVKVVWLAWGIIKASFIKQLKEEMGKVKAVCMEGKDL